MNGRRDQQTYARATTASLLGLAATVALTIALIGLGIWARSQALFAAAWFAGGGIPIWACLWVIYQQHKLALREKLETEELVRGHTEGALFADSAEALMIAERRLEQLYRWVLPATSLLVAIYLAGAVIFQAITSPEAWTVADGSTFWKWDLPARPSPLLAAIAATAFGAFVVSRYLAGMAKGEVWSLLRGGAAFITGIAALLVGIAAGVVAVHFDSGVGLRLMAIFAPVASLLIAAEIALNFLLDLYRPRRAGEAVRPAFDSRLLSLISQPDGLAKTINEAINYQVGFEITRSWFWQLLERSFAPLVGVATLVLIFQSSVVIIEPHQQALVTKMGKIQGGPLGPGLHIKAPWPLAQVKVYDVQRLREVVIGSHGSEEEEGDEHGHDGGEEDEGPQPILWTNSHATEEKLLIVAPPKEVGGKAASSKTPFVSLIGTEIYVHYRIADLVKYAKLSRKPEERFSLLAERAVARRLLLHDIDTWLSGESRKLAGKHLRDDLQEVADRAELGLEVVWVGLAAIHPAQVVATAFHEVVGAQQEKLIAVEKARQGATQTLAEVAGSVDRAKAIVARIEQLEVRRRAAAPEDEVRKLEGDVETLLARAGGKAAQAIADARAYRYTREQGERSKSERFLKELKAFHAAPRLYRMRRYLEVMADGMADGRKYVLITTRKGLLLRFDLKDTGTGVDVMEAVGGRK